MHVVQISAKNGGKLELEANLDEKFKRYSVVKQKRYSECQISRVEQEVRGLKLKQALAHLSEI